jgi:hypothetical protein
MKCAVFWLAGCWLAAGWMLIRVFRLKSQSVTVLRSTLLEFFGYKVFSRLPSDRFYRERTASPRWIKYLLRTAELSSRSKKFPEESILTFETNSQYTRASTSSSSYMYAGPIVL